MAGILRFLESRKRILSVLILLILLAGLFLPFASINASATDTNTWSAGANSSWSVAASWSLGHVPLAGEAVVFDATSVKNCAIDVDTNALYSFSVNSGYSGVITNSANCDLTTTSDITISAGTVTSVTTAVWTCGGNFLQQSGNTLTSNVFNLVMTGSTVTVTDNTANYVNSLTLNDDTTVSGGNSNTFRLNNLIVSSGTTTISTGKTLTARPYLALGGYSNSGTITGGTLVIYHASATPFTLILGVVNSVVQLTNIGTSDAVFNLGASATLGGTLTITGSGTNTMTLSHGSQYTLQVAGLTTLGVRGIMTQGTNPWVFNGGLLINGASGSIFNQGGLVTANGMTLSTGNYNGNGYEIDDSGNFDSTGCNFAQGNGILKMTGTTKTLKTSVTIYNLWITGSITLSSNVRATTYTQDGTLSKLTYTFQIDTLGTFNTDFTFTTAGAFIAPATMVCYGNWNPNGCTYTPGTGILDMMTDGKTITPSPGQGVYDLHIHGSTTIQTNALTLTHSLLIDAGKTLTNLVNLTISTAVTTPITGAGKWTGHIYLTGAAVSFTINVYLPMTGYLDSSKPVKFLMNATPQGFVMDGLGSRVNGTVYRWIGASATKTAPLVVQWNMSMSSGNRSMMLRFGNLTPGLWYYLSIGGSYHQAVQANSSGYANFTVTTAWSDHRFEMYVPTMSITSTPGTSANEGIAYSYHVNVSGNWTSWSFSSNATWLSSLSPWIWGTPTNAVSHRSYWLNLTVSNATDSDWQNWTVFVWNLKPTITSGHLQDQMVGFNTTFHFMADQDGPATPMPSWSITTNMSLSNYSFDPSSGIFTYTPNQTGQFWVNVTFNDGRGAANSTDYSNMTVNITLNSGLIVPSGWESVINAAFIFFVAIPVIYFLRRATDPKKEQKLS